MSAQDLKYITDFVGDTTVELVKVEISSDTTIYIVVEN
jgi:hypothetical protein